MAQPVWVLSVDLQTKTATFQTGLSDAARTARSSFQDIRGGASQMGGAVSYSMSEARHSVMLLGEEFGVHLPRGVTSFLASLGPIGPALEAAFPFLAIAVGATVLIEHLAKMAEAGQKLNSDQIQFGTTVQNVWNQLNDKILQAQIRSDELRGDHLGALKAQLELIDRESLNELVKSFEEVAKAADVVMKDLEGHWYTFGKGSDGAKSALDNFKNQYDSLLAQGKGEQASGLLHGTLTQAQQVLQALQDKKAYETTSDPDDTTFQKGVAAAQVLKGLHVETGLAYENQVKAQQNLVEALEAQVNSESRIAELKKLESGNATAQTGHEMASEAAERQRQAAQDQLRMGQEAIAGDRATADAQLTIHRASIEQRLASDLDFAARERDMQMAANTAEISALDKSGKDYQNQLAALNGKALEIQQQYETSVAQLNAKASVEENQRTITTLEAAIREEIAGTQEGSAQRLSVIAAAMRQEESLGLEQTSFYRELAQQREETLRQEAEQETKIRDQQLEAQIDGAQRAADEQIKHRTTQIKQDSGSGGMQDLSRVAQEKQIEDMTYALQKQALQQELSLYQQMGNEKVKEAQKTQQAIDLLEKQHADKSRDLDQQQAQDTRNSLAQIGNDYAQTFMGIMTGHSTLSRTMEQLTDQATSHMLASAIQMMAGDKETQLSAAKSAAAKAYNAMADIPVVGPELGAVAAAAVFAGAMAFASGGIVPGTGRGDIVPALLEPGESVLPKALTESLTNAARFGDTGNSGHTYNLHYRPTFHVQTIDGDGVRGMLQEHSEEFTRHFQNELRRTNR